jgi:diaminopimelate decarboxylase
MLNESIRYHHDQLHCDQVALEDIIKSVGTPVYIYSLPRTLSNLTRIQRAFAAVQPHIHYSAKANSNLAVLKTLVEAGIGIDVVSRGEIQRALLAGARPANIVFAGVGKTADEIRYALEIGVGWFNVENVAELAFINATAKPFQKPRVALRLNPDIPAPTHRHIATGHKGAKFGLSIATVKDILAQRHTYSNVDIAGLHIHIGSQLHNTEATQQAIEIALDCIRPYPDIRTLNIGGGLAVAYSQDDPVPDWETFAAAVTPLLTGYDVILEPGRSIIADAGILAMTVLYTKEQATERFLITDASMAELIRPALYEAHHEIIPVRRESDRDESRYHIVGPVCESADALGHDVPLPAPQSGEYLAALTAGAYGMVMASNYNQRLRPPEVVVERDGKTWRIARQRETWDDLVRNDVVV